MCDEVRSMMGLYDRIGGRVLDWSPELRVRAALLTTILRFIS